MPDLDTTYRSVVGEQEATLHARGHVVDEPGQLSSVLGRDAVVRQSRATVELVHVLAHDEALPPEFLHVDARHAHI